MRVVFLPQGGFNKSGAFIELAEGASPTGREPEFQRQAPLRMTLQCGNVRLVTTVSAREKPPVDHPEPTLIAPRRLETVGHIQKSRWSSHRFSMMGNTREHHQLTVTVHEMDVGRAHMGGVKAVEDIDFSWDESFYLEVGLPTAKFDALLRDLAQAGAVLMADVEVWKFANFYTTWSPTTGEGRLIKHLDSKRDVENADAIPDEFWNEDLHADLMMGDPLVRLSVHRLIAGTEVLVESPAHDDQPKHMPTVPSPPPAPPAASLTTGFEKGARRVAWALYAVAVALVFFALQ